MPFLLLLISWLLLGCTSAAEDTDAGPDIPSQDVCHDDSSNLLILTDNENYKFESHLQFNTVAVNAHAPITFDWSNVSSDMFGHPLDITQDLDLIQVGLFELTQDELMDRMNNDTLAQTEIIAHIKLPLDGTMTQAEYLDFLTDANSPVSKDVLLSFLDPVAYPKSKFTFAAILNTGENSTKGHRMVTLFEPVSGETNHIVEFTNDSTTIQYTVDFSSKQIVLPSGRADLRIDWEDQVLTNGIGNPFILSRITEARILHYENLSSADLKSQFLDLELIADATYRAEIDASASISTALLTDTQNQPFPGINSQGTWLLALFCNSCANPAPWYLSVLTPCE